MSVLAKNLKIIRKELGCTQSVMSEILRVGFRTFVRYEAGERDVPVSIVIKMARLGNISVEELLTTGIEPNDIAPLGKISQGTNPIKLKSIDFKMGYVTFKDSMNKEMITIDDAEKRILSLFRKMSPSLKNDCVDSMGKIVETGKMESRFSDRDRKVQNKQKNIIKKLKIQIKTPPKPKTKRKPGKEKLG